jgi:mitotic spindle assembly checkpoint protein MAD2
MASKPTSTLSLKGSAAIVAEFFGYSINSILFQRGIYDPEAFEVVKKYGLRVHVASDDALKDYLGKVLAQLTSWLETGNVKKLVLVICGVDTGKTLERWTFDCDTDQPTLASEKGGEESKIVAKEDKDIAKEIGAIIRQITSSVSFLPLLDEPCTFDLLVYTQIDSEVPQTWEESDAKYIANAQQVRLRTFTTKLHKVAASIAYSADDDVDM